jgi:hypothetical protein
MKFNMLLDWCIGKAAAEVKEFYTLPVGEKLIRYDSIAVNTIVKNRSGEVSSCDILYTGDLEQFNREYMDETARTAETAQEISADILQKAYELYYTTENMALICTGDVSAHQIRAAAEAVQNRKAEAFVYFPMEENRILEKYQEKRMDLSRPIFQIGFKFPAVPRENWLQTRIAMGFLLEFLAGESSDFFEKAYRKGLLDEPLGMAYFCGEGYAFAALSAALLVALSVALTASCAFLLASSTAFAALFANSSAFFVASANACLYGFELPVIFISKLLSFKPLTPFG